MKVFPAKTLLAVIDHLSGAALISLCKAPDITAENSAAFGNDFSAIHGQPAARYALEVAAAGGHNILMSGPPGSGKTTMLRDTVRQLSDGIFDRFLRVAVIDSRGELSGSCKGQSVNNLGANTDVLLIEDKAKGAMMALRTMFPDIIAFDEIGTAVELESVSDCFNAGVAVITTAHIGDKSDLFRRSVTSALLKSGIISTVAVLSDRVSGQVEIYDIGELLSDSPF